MGGIGGGTTFGAGTSAGLFGAPVENDPYANIAIDLNKVKKQEAPAKLYEHKTEEEKKEAAKKSAANTTTKSNLKKDVEVEEKKKASEKRGVTFGKSTTYEVDRESNQSTDGINKDNLGDGRGSPRLDKKVVAEKDLGDGRSEKEKILELLEK
jgi:hypothetical protein